MPNWFRFFLHTPRSLLPNRKWALNWCWYTVFNQLYGVQREKNRQRIGKRCETKLRKEKRDRYDVSLLNLLSADAINWPSPPSLTSSPPPQRPKNCLLSDEFNKAVLCLIKATTLRRKRRKGKWETNKKRCHTLKGTLDEIKIFRQSEHNIISNSSNSRTEQQKRNKIN